VAEDLWFAQSAVQYQNFGVCQAIDLAMHPKRPGSSQIAAGRDEAIKYTIMVEVKMEWI
jgi:hypothetical protein